MPMIIASPDALLRNGVPDLNLAQVLIDASNSHNPVGVFSNHSEPPWFQKVFGCSGVQFLQCAGRQSGDVVAINAKKFSLSPQDVIVLASKGEDVQMGKNGHAVLVASGWSIDNQVKSLGIKVDTPIEFKEIVDLTAGWSGQWWFSSSLQQYEVKALCDLSGYGKPVSQQQFAQMLTNTIKNGGGRLNALLTVTARSFLMDGVDTVDGLVWGVYPSSKSANNDQEVLSDFTHRLRTTVSRVRFSKRDEPLFIRHTHSAKRSHGGGGDRTDPSEQVMTIHINPFYKESSRLVGKHVIVIDDCTTYGVSFGVAAAFLRKAGAASVTGVALGKFGSQLRCYDIEIKTDPFKPVQAGGFTTHSSATFPGKTSAESQQILRSLIQ